MHSQTSKENISKTERKQWLQKPTLQYRILRSLQGEPLDLNIIYNTQPNSTAAQIDEQVREALNIEEVLQQRKGAFIEIGGPTPSKYSLERPYKSFDIHKLPKKLITTNIALGVTQYEYSDEAEEEVPVAYFPADLQADGLRLPFADSGIGAVFVSNLPIIIREAVFQEISRVLEPGGVVIWEGGTTQDRQFAQNAGLNVKVQIVPPNSDSIVLEYIFQK